MTVTLTLQNVLAEYRVAVLEASREDDEFWDYLYKGLFWRASSAAYTAAIYWNTVKSIEFRYRMLLRELGVPPI